VVAAVLTDGTVTREQTSAARRQDPALQALAARVTLLPDPALEPLYPEHWAARVRIRTAAGAEHQLQYDDPFGTDARPASDAVIHDKFRRMAGSVLPADRVERLIETVEGLERLPSLQPLTNLLLPARQP
jgi:2-methylcitrate dehydratase PrpD